MQQQRAKLPGTMQLPVMYVAPHRSIAYGYAHASDMAAFETIRKTAQEDGISLSLLYTYLAPDRNDYFGAFVLDLTSAKADGSGLAEKIGRLPGVERVLVRGHHQGLAAAEQQQLEVAGAPVAIFARDIIGDTYRRLGEAMGAEAEAILWEVGVAAGRRAASGVSGLVRTLELSLSPQLVQERLRDLEVFGWARVIAVRVEDDLAGEALLADDFEAAAWDGAATSAKCYWLRGFIAGVLETLQNKPFEVTESECQAKRDPYCRISFGPRPAEG